MTDFSATLKRMDQKVRDTLDLIKKEGAATLQGNLSTDLRFREASVAAMILAEADAFVRGDSDKFERSVEEFTWAVNFVQRCSLLAVSPDRAKYAQENPNGTLARERYREDMNEKAKMLYNAIGVSGEVHELPASLRKAVEKSITGRGGDLRQGV